MCCKLEQANVFYLKRTISGFDLPELLNVETVPSYHACQVGCFLLCCHILTIVHELYAELAFTYNTSAESFLRDIPLCVLPSHGVILTTRCLWHLLLNGLS